MPDDAQPDQGQGSEAPANPWDSYLQTAPEGVREAGEAWFKDTSKGLNEKLEEAAELRKQWEPYQDLELPPPDQLNELLAWSSQTLTSQETFDEWVAQQAQEKGWTRAEVEANLEAEPEDLSPERIQQIADERAQQLLGPVEQQINDLVQERGIDLETQGIRDALGTLEKDGKVELTEDQRAMVIDLGMPASVNEKGEDLPVGDTSWVSVGFERFKQITSEGQKAFVESASQQPASAMTTGGQAQQKPVTEWGDAKEILRDRWKQMQT